MKSKYPDQTLRMCRVMWILTNPNALFRLSRHTCHKTSFKRDLPKRNSLQWITINDSYIICLARIDWTYKKTDGRGTIQIYRKFHLQKHENFQIKNSDIFHNSAQNIDCGYSLEPPWRGGSNEYPQSMFWAEIRKIMYTPANPSFTI